MCRRLEDMIQLFSYVAPVIRLAQYYRLGWTFSDAYAASLALVSRYLDCTAVVQVRHVVWADPEARCAEDTLHANMELNGIDSRNWVIQKIETVMDKYFRAFNLVGVNESIDRLLEKGEH